MKKILLICSFLSMFSAMASGKKLTVEQLNERPAQIDSNGDGKPDIWQTFNANGALEKAEYDRDFDGKSDEWVSFSDGYKDVIRIMQDDKTDKQWRRKFSEERTAKGKFFALEIFDETAPDKWELIERRSPVAKSRNIKIEHYKEGKLLKQYTRPGDLD